MNYSGKCGAKTHNLPKSDAVCGKQSLTNLFSKQILNAKRIREKSVFIHLYIIAHQCSSTTVSK